MPQITLTPDQAAVLDAARQPVRICRPDGSLAGFLSPKTRLFVPDQCPFTPDEIAAALKEAERSPCGSTTQEVLRRLRGQPSS